MTASLRLFNAVISSSEDNQEFEFLSDYGVVITPSAYHRRREIKEYLKQSKLDGVQLNSSFHKSWSKVATASIEQLVTEQIIHYFSTYGLEFFGYYDDNYIYIPPEELEIPERVAVLKIHGLPKQVLISKCFSLLSSGVALEQTTIEDLLAVLDECDYQWTGDEEIKNREAQAIIISRTGILPTSPDTLFRYIFYQATGSTLVIKNDFAISTIIESKFALPNLNEEQKKSLAAGFNRKKPLWLAFKKANKDNVSVVNHIAKLSKKYHKALPVNILGTITTLEYSLAEIEKAIRKANNFQIIRALNALRLYSSTYTRFYRIRNGKGWFENKEKVGSFDTNKAEDYEKLLLSYLKQRLSGKKVYFPSNISYVAPTSEKQFSGNFPKGTMFILPNTGSKVFLAGIYWQGSMVDLDLKADNLTSSVGWNTSYRNQELLYSGDVTSAPNGATEWMYCKGLSESYIIKVNGYTLPQNDTEHPFKILLGYGNSNQIEENYIIDPNNLMFEIESTMTQKEKILGVWFRNKAGLAFTLIDIGSGESRVSRQVNSGLILQHIIDEQETKLRLEEILENATMGEDADVNLSPELLTKDSILSLLTQ